MKNAITESTAKEENCFELANCYTTEVGYTFCEIFGQLTIKELRKQLTTDIRDILQNAIQTTPIENPHAAAKASLLFSLILECIINFDEDEDILNIDNSKMGKCITDLLWMFTDIEMKTWANDAIDYFMSLHRTGLQYDQQAQIIGNLNSIKMMINLVVNHAKETDKLQPVSSL